MNFERLNNSITLNDGEQPSIYMAMCLIESMFKDMARCFRGKQTCQLYRDYLDNFRINQTRQTR